ncbi:MULTISPECIES: hypothetical protein [unclassified Caulobacter]|uniref:hypothetical protein n=1 Tax=unclassified Caulobacter TaxID=2648921 RepID=UPI0004A6E77E|nr:hypothetical protein [Caulobacter sp. UNC358MFTsu5.1]
MSTMFLFPGDEPVTVTLSVDSQVFLHKATLGEEIGAHTRLVPLSAKTEDTATWTGLVSHDDVISLDVSWVVVHNATPGRPYVATVTVTDAAGNLLRPRKGSANPTHVKGQIGPAGNPTDFGHQGVFIG